jgi:hypothetical protein
MEEMTFDEMKRKLKAGAKAVNEAQATVRLRTEQLNELKPKRQKLEKESEAKWGVPIAELPEHVSKKRQECAAAIEAFSKKVEEALTVE